MNSLFFGRRGEGKTTLALHRALERKRGVAIYDINARFTRWPKSTTSDLGEFSSLVDSSDFSLVVFRPLADVAREFDGFAECLWSKQNFCLLVDEASQLQTSARAHPWLDRFVRMAPRDSVDIFQTMHRPADAATICRALADDWYIFRTVRRIDLEVLENECSPEVRLAAESFIDSSHHYVRWDDAHAKMELCADPSIWNEDL